MITNTLVLAPRANFHYFLIVALVCYNEWMGEVKLCMQRIYISLAWDSLKNLFLETVRLYKKGQLNLEYINFYLKWNKTYIYFQIRIELDAFKHYDYSRLLINY